MQGLTSQARGGVRTSLSRTIRAFPLIAATLALATVAACKDDATPTQVTPAITVSVGTPATVASPGVPATVPVTVIRTGGFTGDVALTAEGLPTGATAVFSPATVPSGSTNSVMTITLGATAVASNGTVTVRATGSGVTASTTTLNFTANIPANPSITLTNATSTLSVPQGQNGNVALTLERLGGFTGIVSVAVEGLPTGVTTTPISFGAGVTNATLAFNVGSAAAPGVTNVTVRASGTGITDKTVTIQLTITSSTAPDFTLTATPASLSVAPGATGQSTINLARTGGFTGNVTFSTSTLPTGATATFTPNPATATTSTLAIATTAATPAGLYNITVTGAATGQTSRTTTIALTVSAAPGVSISLSSTSASVAAGTSTATTITLTRNGGLTGDLTMAAENLPTGASVTFAPASPVAGTSTVATINTTAATAAGVYTINLRATGTGGVTTTAAFTLTVTSAQGFSVAFTSGSASIAAGGSGTLTANITRTGGFAGTVNFAVTGLPAAITTSLNPAAAAGASTILTVNVAAGTAAGTYNGVLNGTSTGLTSTATAFSVIVTGGGGGGGGNVQWAFCDATRIPLFFAFRDGASGAWTRVTGSGSNVFSFTLTQSVGGVAYVLPSGGGFATTVFLQTASELQSQANSECTNSPAAGTKTLFGTTTGLAVPSGTSTQAATITMGNSTATASSFSSAFTLTKVLPGPQDLIATRTTQTLSPFSSIVDGIIFRRALNLGDGAAITPTLNFGAGGEALAIVTAPITINNAGSDVVQLITQFISSNGTTATLGTSLGAANTIYGVPSGSTVAGDLHRTFVNSANTVAGTQRITALYFKDVAAKTVTFGPNINLPTITTVASTVLRPRLQGTIQTEYQTAFGAGFTQGTTNRSVTLSASRAYFNGSTYDFDTPDLVGVSGYNSTWGLTIGTATTYSISALNTSFVIFTDGSSFAQASRTGDVTPVALRR